MCTFICEKGRYGAGSIHWIFLKINCRKCDVNSFTSGSHVRREIWLIKEHLFDNTVLFFYQQRYTKAWWIFNHCYQELKNIQIGLQLSIPKSHQFCFFHNIKEILYKVCKHAISTCTYNILQFSMEKKKDKMTRLMNAVNEIWALHLNLSYNTPEGEGKKSNVGLVRMKWENSLIANLQGHLLSGKWRSRSC